MAAGVEVIAFRARGRGRDRVEGRIRSGLPDRSGLYLTVLPAPFIVFLSAQYCGRPPPRSRSTCRKALQCPSCRDILVFFQTTPALDAQVVAWARYEASRGAGIEDLVEESEPPYKDAMAAMRDGWQIIQMSELRHTFAQGRIRPGSAALPDRPGEIQRAAAGGGSRAMSEHLLSSKQMARFVASGYLKFEEMVPVDLCRACLEEMQHNRGYLAVGTPFEETWSKGHRSW